MAKKQSIPGIRTKSIKRVRTSNYGLYIWKLPDGKPLMDDDFNMLCIESEFGDLLKMAELRQAARYWGFPDGEPEFYEGCQLTDEEYEAEVDAFLGGQE